MSRILHGCCQCLITGDYTHPCPRSLTMTRGRLADSRRVAYSFLALLCCLWYTAACSNQRNTGRRTDVHIREQYSVRVQLLFCTDASVPTIEPRVWQIPISRSTARNYYSWQMDMTGTTMRFWYRRRPPTGTMLVVGFASGLRCLWVWVLTVRTLTTYLCICCLSKL